MRSVIVVVLIVAVALLIAGGVLVAVGVSNLKKNGNHESVLTNREVVIQEHFESVLVNTADCNVTFAPCQENEQPRVEIKDREKIHHEAKVEDGVLKIQMVDKRQWMDYFVIADLSWERMHVNVYMPQKEYESLNIHTATGDIKIPDTFSAKEILIKSETGRVQCAAAASDLVDCNTTTGDIQISNCTPEKLRVNSNTGRMALSAISRSGEITAKNNTGEVSMTDVICKSLNVKTTTGHISLSACDSEQANLESTTGNVSGNFRTPKRFNTHTTTGNVDVNSSSEGNPCQIRTTTGNISFR